MITYVLCDFIGHPTFQMGKVLVTRNLRQVTRHFPPGALMASHETRERFGTTDDDGHWTTALHWEGVHTF